MEPNVRVKTLAIIGGCCIEVVYDDFSAGFPFLRSRLVKPSQGCLFTAFLRAGGPFWTKPFSLPF